MNRLAIAMTLLLFSRVASATDPIAVTVDGPRVEFRAGPAVFARFNAALTEAKTYFWPIFAPNGAPVTRGWPMEAAPTGGSMDHPHQKSAWFAHGDVIPEGVDIQPRKKNVEGVDYWAEIPIHGKIIGTEIGKPKDGKVTVRQEWRSPAGAVLLEEARTMSAVDLGVGRMIVVELELKAPNSAIVFGDTKEGTFGVRVNDQIRTDPGKDRKAPATNVMTNSNGAVGEKECWGRRADWCDYSGIIDGKHAGIAIFDDPANAQRACWHVRGYGLMAANPFGRAKSGFPDVSGRTDVVKLAKSESLRLRYAIYAHDGDVKTGRVAEAFEKFVKTSK